MKIWNIFGDIILFKGVDKYQTLIAGLAAIIGGSFVLISTILSANEITRKENKIRFEEAISACTIVSNEFKKASYQMLYYKYSDDIPYFTNTPAFLPKLTRIDPMLADIVASCKNNTMLFLTKDMQTSNLKQVHVTAIECYMVWQILLHVAKNISPLGDFDLQNTNNIPSSDLKRMTRSLLAKPEDVIGYYSFFNWYASDNSPVA